MKDRKAIDVTAVSKLGIVDITCRIVCANMPCGLELVCENWFPTCCLFVFKSDVSEDVDGVMNFQSNEHALSI